MSVIHVERDIHLEGQRQGSEGAGYAVEMTDYWRVTTDDPRDGADVVLLAEGLPQRGDAYRDGNGFEDEFVLCQRRTARNQVEDPTKWTVENLYTSDATNFDRENIDPLLEAPKIKWDTDVLQRYISVDLNGELIQSSAGELYPGGVAVEVYIRTLHLTRNESFYNRDQADIFQGTANLKPIWGYGIGMAYLYKINAVDAHAFRGGIEFAEMQYIFKLAKPLTDPASGDILNYWHTPALLDAGLHELDANNALKPIQFYGHPISQPAALDGGGHAGRRVVTDAQVIIVGQDFFLLSLTANFTAADSGATVSVESGSPDGPDQGVVSFFGNNAEVRFTSFAGIVTGPGQTAIITRPAAYLFPKVRGLEDWADLDLPLSL